MEFVRKKLKSKTEGYRANRAGGTGTVPEGEVLPTVDNQEYIKAAPCPPEDPSCSQTKPTETTTGGDLTIKPTKMLTSMTIAPTTGAYRTVEFTNTTQGNLTVIPGDVTPGSDPGLPVTMPSTTNATAGKVSGLFILDSTTAAIIGGVAGAVLLVLFILVAILLCLLCKRKGGKKRQRAMAENPQYTTESEFQLYDRINENPDPENPYHEPYDPCVAPPLPQSRPPYDGLGREERTKQDKSHYAGLLKVNSLYYNKKKKNKGGKGEGTPYAVVPIEPSQSAPKAPSAESPDLSVSREGKKEPHYYVLESPQTQLKNKNLHEQNTQNTDKGPHYYTLEPPPALKPESAVAEDEADDYTKPEDIAANRRPEYLELIESDDQMSADSGRGTSSFTGKPGSRYVMENKNNSNNFNDDFENEQTVRKTVESDYTDRKVVESEETDRKVVGADDMAKKGGNQRYVDHPVFSIT
ncbi:uncharacterized protein LOC106170436 isoform X2 [Lingula anatina]|uniref:Uncharacterized protein LOC106170436 isoform X2 n=1 Tax=Lingula anatina TaxID=7574 RepID=A0A1S3J675_LINAN|nr:uncharacterized protein LOC106170436 isoform X2 [Lingula anatina]|eukprot:XP_013405751.1 uncharacterized protein LOC106170436 isoform X2 [Lingula anatina]